MTTSGSQVMSAEFSDKKQIKGFRPPGAGAQFSFTVILPCNAEKLREDLRKINSVIEYAESLQTEPGNMLAGLMSAVRAGLMRKLLPCK